MNELRFTALCLQGQGREFPTLEYAEKSAAKYRKKAEDEFRQWLGTMPQEMRSDIESNALSLVSAWMDESYERGFTAGIRLMCQALTENP